MSTTLRLGRFLAVSALRYACVAAINRLPFRASKGKVTDLQGFFFRHHLRQLVGRDAIRSVTVQHLYGEGAGSQALMIMCAINFANYAGLTYLHQPFENVAHAIGDPKAYATAWEKFFSYGSGERHFEAGTDRAFTYNAYHFPGTRWERNTALDRNFERLIPTFKEKYLLNAPPRQHRGSERTVAVHIRRGDVSSSSNAHLYTSTETIAHRITVAVATLRRLSQESRVCVFSEGDPADFGSLTALGAELRLNEDPLSTMREMIEADVLLTGKGSFSYVAALLCDGVVVSESTYTPLSHWVVCDLQGGFDAGALEHRLREKAWGGAGDMARRGHKLKSGHG